MADYCRAWGVDIAPHGKTTMAPQLWDRQLAAGAWGITAATVGQARVMRAAGVGRVLIANEVVDPVAIAWVAEQLADPAFELLCYVDSDRTVDILDAGLRAAGADRPLPVLVELGFEGGRTGCRTIPEAVHVAIAGRRPRIVSALAGVSGYEGTICQDRSPECLARVIALPRSPPRADVDLDRHRRGFDGADRIVLSAGGSAFFDVVVDRLRGPWPSGADVRVVLRSGCYLTHDSGMYERLSPLPSRDGARGFQPAMELWAHVLSRPEPELALFGFGKRDVPFDVDLPSPVVIRRASGDAVDANGALEIRSLNDQHAYARVRADLAARARRRGRVRHQPPVHRVRQVAGHPGARRRRPGRRRDRDATSSLLRAPFGDASRTMTAMSARQKVIAVLASLGMLVALSSAASARGIAGLTLTASSKNVAFHGLVTLVATVEPAVAGQEVSIVDASGVVDRVRDDGTDGTFSVDVRPAANVVVHASSLGVDSAPVSVGVRPLVTL